MLFSRRATGWEPSSITTTMWLDPSDTATAYQDSAGTTPGAVGSPVGKRLDKSGNDLHVVQATSAARPTLDLTSSVYSDVFDAVDDGYSVASGTFGADVDCFVALKRGGTSETKGVMFFDSADEYFGYWQHNGGGTSHSGVGSSITQYVNGVAIAGGTTPTPIQTSAAIPVGQWCIYEARNLNLSTWAALNIGNYAGFLLNGSIGGVVLCPAQSSENRTLIRQYLAGKVGVTL